MKHTYEIGKTYGVKKVLSVYKKDGQIMADVECIKCGKRTTVRARQLYNEKHISCQCTKIREDYDIKSNKRLYGTFHNMKYRCNTKTSDAYHNYGARGINVCDEWDGEDGFLHFKTWALNNGYKYGLTIDRINPDLGYSPDNCRWITKSLNTSLANKSMRVQHRKSNLGTYYAIDKDGVYLEFDNAAEFGRQHNLDGQKIRYCAHKKLSYCGYLFGFVFDNNIDRPQSTIEKIQGCIEVEYTHGETPYVEAPGTVL